MHLLMSVSYEFSKSKGLDIVGGRVSRLEPVLNSSGRRSKVPQVGWNTISREGRQSAEHNLSETLLAGVSDGAYMYFVHSYYVTPDDLGIVSTTTEYGGARFCSSFSVGNVFACQFHPERSGAEGLKIYRNMTKLLEKRV
jgi:glutamine amidotransferase